MAFKLAYFSTYFDLNEKKYTIRIFKDTDEDISSVQINATAKLSFDEARNLDPIRKSRVELTILANKDQTFFDLLPQSEQDIKVEIEREEVSWFSGFILPDGFFQDYVNEQWQSTLIASDGLDLLSNFAYVDENGENFTGTQTTVQILNNALKRTGLNLNILIAKSGNSFSAPDPEYVIDQNLGLYGSFWNNTKIDNIAFYDDEPKTCEEVIEELVKISGYMLCQQDGFWILTRIASLATNQFETERPIYESYVDGVFNTTFERRINREVGDEVAGYFPHWCNENQKIEAVPSLGANRAVYDFGEPKTLIDNFDLINDGSTMADWTVLQADPNLFEFENESSIRITTPSGTFDAPEEMIRSTVTDLLSGDILKIQTKWFALTDLTGLWFLFKLTNTDTATDYYFSSDDNTWKSGGVFSYREALTSRFNQLVTAEITTAVLPENGDLEITLLEPFATSYDYSSNFNPFDKEIIVDSIRVNIEDGSGAIGQEITSQRIANPSSVTQENETFFLGGTLTKLEYDGTLLDSSDEPITTGWVNELSNFPKAIMVTYLEDFHVLRGSTSLYFSGDVFGYIPYVSRVKIIGLEGVFHVVGYEYDTYTDIVSLVLLQLHSDTTVFADLNTDIIIKYNESENAKIV